MSVVYYIAYQKDREWRKYRKGITDLAVEVLWGRWWMDMEEDSVRNDKITVAIYSCVL